jgi:protein-disulfide isomerase
LIIALLVVAGSRQHERKRFWPLLFCTGLLYSASSLVLAWISSTIIHSYCIMCILLYVVNFLLLYYAWFVNRRFGDTDLLKGLVRDMQLLWRQRKMSLPIVGLFVFTTAGFAVGMPAYWQMTPPALSDAVASGITDDGHPWIGAQKPSLTITEFSDYMCFQCKKMHFFLRKLVQLHPDQVRLVHRHFPMDKAYNPLVSDIFHAGAGEMAIIALYAKQKGKFWEVNDLLFSLAEKKTSFNTRTISKQVGISNNEISAALKSRTLRLSVKHDISVGINKGITGTPSFLIDGKIYSGNIPSGILTAYLNRTRN